MASGLNVWLPCVYRLSPGWNASPRSAASPIEIRGTPDDTSGESSRRRAAWALWITDRAQSSSTLNNHASSSSPELQDSEIRTLPAVERTVGSDRTEIGTKNQPVFGNAIEANPP